MLAPNGFDALSSSKVLGSYEHGLAQVPQLRSRNLLGGARDALPKLRHALSLLLHRVRSWPAPALPGLF